MKKCVVLLFIQLFFTTVVLAQAQIGSFYGLRLGMTISEVRSALSSQGKTMESKEDYYIVDSPKLGDITFDALWLYFKDSKLTKADFFCYYGKAPFPNDSWYDQAVDMVSSKAQNYKAIYDDMHLNLVSKYGKPQIDGDEKAVWRKELNQITLLHSFNIDKTFEFHEVTTKVKIIYESLSKNVNY